MTAFVVLAAGLRNGTTSFANGGGNGYYWSAGPYYHASNPNNSYNMNFNNGNLNEGNNNNNRYNGFTVRCVAALSTYSFLLSGWPG